MPDATCSERTVGGDAPGGNEKHPDVPTEKVGLQELAFASEFDGAICVDAMENVFRRTGRSCWGNLRRAIRPGGYLYFTVETIDEQEIADVYAEAIASGIPVV